jgi:hypothetical protein
MLTKLLKGFKVVKNLGEELEDVGEDSDEEELEEEEW